MDSSVFEFTRVRYVVGIERADLSALQREQGDGVAVITDKLHLKGSAVAMHQYRRAHVTANQPVFGQVAGQGHGVQFVDRLHNLGNGCASRIGAHRHPD